jgi:hypothetical protein
MQMIRNKKGFVWFLIIIPILIIVASIIGIIFVGKLSGSLNEIFNNLGWNKILISIVVILVIIFRDIVKSVLMTLIGLFKR